MVVLMLVIMNGVVLRSIERIAMVLNVQLIETTTTSDRNGRQPRLVVETLLGCKYTGSEGWMGGMTHGGRINTKSLPLVSVH